MMHQTKNFLGYGLYLILLVSNIFATQHNSLESEFLNKLTKKFARFICYHCPQKHTTNIDNAMEITDSSINIMRYDIDKLRTLYELMTQESHRIDNLKQEIEALQSVVKEMQWK